MSSPLATGPDLLPFLVTFLVSFWEVQYGIVCGVAISGAMLLYHTARPRLKVGRPSVPQLQGDSLCSPERFIWGWEAEQQPC